MSRWERREQKRISKKSRVAKHGKSMAYIYAMALEKRLKHGRRKILGSSKGG